MLLLGKESETLSKFTEYIKTEFMGIVVKRLPNKSKKFRLMNYYSIQCKEYINLYDIILCSTVINSWVFNTHRVYNAIKSWFFYYYVGIHITSCALLLESELFKICE